MLYINKIEAIKGQIGEHRMKKQTLMAEREQILKKREALMAQDSDQKQTVETLKMEIKHAESKMDTLQRLRAELVTKQIETQSFVD